jgi:hypothetical protein
MKEVLSLFTCGIAAVLFLAFLTSLKPNVVSAASGPDKSGECSTDAAPSHLPLARICHQLSFLAVVQSDDQVKEVFLEPPRATSISSPATSPKNQSSYCHSAGQRATNS